MIFSCAPAQCANVLAHVKKRAGRPSFVIHSFARRISSVEVVFKSSHRKASVTDPSELVQPIPAERIDSPSAPFVPFLDIGTPQFGLISHPPTPCRRDNSKLPVMSRHTYTGGFAAITERRLIAAEAPNVDVVSIIKCDSKAFSLSHIES